MKVIGVCNLTIDNYFVDGTYFGSMFGGTVSNIIANLASFGIKTSLLGCCGNDDEGKLIVENLKKLKINLEGLKEVIGRTRRINVVIKNNKLISSKYRCPICHEKIKVIGEEIVDFSCDFDQQTIVIFDNINKNNINLAKKAKDRGATTMIDIGYKSKFESVNLSDCFDIVQLNERVAKYLLESNNYNNYIELNKIFNASLIVITLSKAGTIYLFEGEEIFKKIIDPVIEIDPSGAGDIFYSVFIKNYILGELNVEMLDRSFNEGVKAVKKIVKKIGAISHLLPFEKISGINGCNCQVKK